MFKKYEPQKQKTRLVVGGLSGFISMKRLLTHHPREDNANNNYSVFID
jgi:hypothetical protein